MTPVLLLVTSGLLFSFNDVLFLILVKEIELVDEQIKIHNVCKSKFNGNLVLKLTQRTGKQLGALMKILKSKLTDNVVYHMCVEEIENIILQEHYKLLKEERIQSEQENMRFIDE